MLKKGPAKKVTVYLNEDTRVQHEPLYQAVMEFLFNKGVAGATLIRPHSGFGPHHRLHSPDMEATMTQLPVRVEFIDTPERVESLMPLLYDLVSDGLIELQDAVIVKAVSQNEPATEAPLVRHKEQQAAKLLRVFLGEADQWEGGPLYDAIVKKLRMLEVAGATVYRGILGYGAKGRTHKEGFLHLSRDLPVMISVVDSAEKIGEAISAVEAMLGDGLIVVSDVDMIRLVHVLPSEVADGAR
jgi:PII-like signaling protein